MDFNSIEFVYRLYDLPHFGHNTPNWEKNIYKWEIDRKSSNANNNSINISERCGEKQRVRTRTKREMIRVCI